MSLFFLLYDHSCKSLQLSYITGRNCQLKPNQHSVKAGTRPSASHFLLIFDLLVPRTPESSGKVEDARGGRGDQRKGLIHFVWFPVPQLTAEHSDLCRDSSGVKFPPVALQDSQIYAEIIHRSNSLLWDVVERGEGSVV